ncbi:MAG: 1,4-dihydroxy-6-naphthoate synthase [Bacteroidales bacterium]|jgi:1,4-dihydroxy-6-naphthoate synthase|nr:1,4-dihydroxy-6-naphthoate synthase [Bacteroidales bacterium]
MKLTLGFSPCPNDTFIFDALVNGKIDTEGLEFDYFLADVEELNRRAFNAHSDITKISCHAYAYASGNYLILDSGSALGYGSGPLLISRKPMRNEDVSNAVIAIPGKYTTANLLFSIAWPDARNKKEYLFSEIVNTLLEGKADAGLIIHETRFTYEEKGLVKIADMGEFWEKLTGLPVPLGFIVINRQIPGDIALKFNRILHRSIEYARKYSSQQQEFVTSNAREIEISVIGRHIDLYVNDFTLTLGPVGRKAVSELYHIAAEKGVIPELPESIFLE